MEKTGVVIEVIFLMLYNNLHVELYVYNKLPLCFVLFPNLVPYVLFIYLHHEYILSTSIVFDIHNRHKNVGNDLSINIVARFHSCQHGQHFTTILQSHKTRRAPLKHFSLKFNTISYFYPFQCDTPYLKCSSINFKNKTPTRKQPNGYPK